MTSSGIILRMLSLMSLILSDTFSFISEIGGMDKVKNEMMNQKVDSVDV